MTVEVPEIEFQTIDAGAFKSVGRPLARREDERLITGKGRFTDDFNAPGQVHAVLVRWPDWPQLALLSAPVPATTDTIVAIVTDLIRARLGLTIESPPAVADERLPVRMSQPRAGAQETGWLRPVLGGAGL